LRPLPQCVEDVLLTLAAGHGAEQVELVQDRGSGVLHRSLDTRQHQRAAGGLVSDLDHPVQRSCLLGVEHAAPAQDIERGGHGAYTGRRRRECQFGEDVRGARPQLGERLDLRHGLRRRS